MKGIETESSFPAFHALRLRSALQHQLFGEEERVQRMGTFLREVIERGEETSVAFCEVERLL